MPSQRLPTSHSALQVQLPSGAAPLAASPSAAAASTSCSSAAAAADGAASDVTLLSSRILRNQAAARRVLCAQETLIEGVHSLPRFRSLVALLNDASYLAVLEERHLLSHCAYPLCSRAPSHAARADSEPTYRLAPRSRQILPDARLQAGGEWTYCGRKCWARSMWVRRWVLKEQEVRAAEAAELLEELEMRGEVTLPEDEASEGSRRSKAASTKAPTAAQATLPAAASNTSAAPRTTASSSSANPPRLRLRPAKDSAAATLFAPHFPPPAAASAVSPAASSASRRSSGKAASRLPLPLPPAAPPSSSSLASASKTGERGKAINGALRIIERPPPPRAGAEQADSSSLASEDASAAPRLDSHNVVSRTRGSEAVPQEEEELETEEEDAEVAHLFAQMHLAREEERRAGRWEESSVRAPARGEGGEQGEASDEE